MKFKTPNLQTSLLATSVERHVSWVFIVLIVQFSVRRSAVGIAFSIKEPLLSYVMYHVYSLHHGITFDKYHVLLSLCNCTRWGGGGGEELRVGLAIVAFFYQKGTNITLSNDLWLLVSFLCLMQYSCEPKASGDRARLYFDL